MQRNQTQSLRADALAAVKYVAEQCFETTYQVNGCQIDWYDDGDDVVIHVVHADGRNFRYSPEDAPAEVVSHFEEYGRAGLQSLVNSGLTLQRLLNTQEFEIAQFKDLLTLKIANLKADDPTSYISHTDDPDVETRIMNYRPPNPL